MNQRFDTILKSGTVVNQDGEGIRDIGIAKGRIGAIGGLGQASAAEMIDCKGLHILPGVIDTQVHFREPGQTQKEDLETGSRSAVMGGVTAVFEMPNTDPLTVTAATFADKIKRGRHRMHCDFAFFIGGTRENVQDLPELERAPGCAGVKVFIGSSTGALLVEDDESLRRIFAVIRRRAAFHAEDEYRLNERKPLRIEGDPRSHPIWRDETAALMATQRLVNLARESGKRIHVLHISTRQEIEYLRDHKDVASCEATPHHLTLVAPECYERLGTRAQMNPPVRSADHRDGIWYGIEQGIIDVLGSDHAPHTLEAVMLDYVNAGRLSLARLVDLTSAGPARLYNIACKGRIAAGYDADFTIVDLKRSETITNKWVASRAGWTPYDGVRVTGWPVGTFVRGKRVMWQGEVATPSTGEPVRFLETLKA
jgi:dihydroorotase